MSGALEITLASILCFSIVTRLKVSVMVGMKVVR